MIFNSIDFIVFLPLVFCVFWIFGNKKVSTQNIIILVSSYIFYGWWDWRYLALIITSTVIDYSIGLKLQKSKNQKSLLILSLLLNLGLLCFFKYMNFFIESFTYAFTFLGHTIEPSYMNIVLPVGISFYTFQTMSYTIDIYKNDLKPTKNFIAFGSFVSFFPQLVAGPIERASNLLPQFYNRSIFSIQKSKNGLRQILWGLFKKMAIGDYCAKYSDMIFDNYEDYKGPTLFVGAVLFSFQIYCDFSGYSDIAIGTSKLFGFNLKKNFNFPYFSKTIPEFWKKWHISLTTWFRDYIYIPLGGSKMGKRKTIRNILIVFTISGFWHGANWTFIIWGLLNGLLFLPSLYKKYTAKTLVVKWLQILSTFSIVSLTWIFFRSESITQSLSILGKIFSEFNKKDFIEALNFIVWNIKYPLLFLIALFLIIEWLGKENEFALETFLIKQHYLLRWTFYSFIVFLIGMYSETTETPFIYFQF